MGRRRSVEPGDKPRVLDLRAFCLGGPSSGVEPVETSCCDVLLLL